MIAHINIGSNLGDRTYLTGRAVTLLSGLGTVIAVSKPYFSAPWGYESDNEFCNVGVNLETSLQPSDLLEGLRAIESEIDPDGTHRTAAGTYADRAIDLDLIACGEETIEEADGRLTVPHPRMHLRNFVLAPMAEIWPAWRHPSLGKTPGELLSDLQQ